MDAPTRVKDRPFARWWPIALGVVALPSALAPWVLIAASGLLV